MDHDLELINTAIRLGDVVIPPVGSKIRARDTFGAYFVGIVSMDTLFLAVLAAGGSRMFIGFVPGSTTVLELPADAPPFEDWYRPHADF